LQLSRNFPRDRPFICLMDTKHISTSPFIAALILMLCCGLAAWAQDNCTRGMPVPVVKASVYPNVKFTLSPDERSGTETVSLRRGERLVVRNWGCESYVLTFRFETASYRHNPRDLEFWFRNALRRMKEIYPALEAPIDIRKGLQKLRSYIETQRKGKARKLELGREIVFDGYERGDIRQFVTVDKVQKLKSGIYALEISFSAGPL
jgi:hypothetical protein